MSQNYNLLKSFNDNNYRKSIENLEIYGANPNFYVEAEGCTIFEHILSTPCSAVLIRKCIENGADFNVKNDVHRYPLHYIIESQCIENLKEIECFLSFENKILKSSPFVNVKDATGRNAMHMLAEKLTNESYDVIFPMMKVLLRHGCNINIQNHEGKTPFFIVAEKLPQLEKGKEIVDYFIENGDVDFNMHKNDEILEMVLSERMSKEQDFIPSYESMRKLLVDGEINKFESYFLLFKNACTNVENFYEKCSEFMETAVLNSLLNIVDLLIHNEVDINRISKISAMKIPPIFIAYKNGNFGILKSFLLSPRVKLSFEDGGKHETILQQFYSNIKIQLRTKRVRFVKEVTENERKCFDLLMDHPKCDREFINARDEFNHPAIYYSVRYKTDYITTELLKRGAYIEPVITKIRKSLLNDFLDSCIDTNDRYHDGEDFEITISYKFLMPAFEHQKNVEKSSNGDARLQIVKDSNKHLATEEKYNKEIEPLAKIAEDSEFRQLIIHPVLSSFVLLKWSQIHLLVYINLVLTLFYMFTFIPFIIIYDTIPKDQHKGNILIIIFYILSFISLSLIIIRELMQFILSPRQYIRYTSNCIDMILIVASSIILLNLASERHEFRMLHTVIILLTVLEYFNILGFLPLLSISLYTKMFKKVFQTFLKSLAFFSVMILGFAISFYTMQGNKFKSDLEKYVKKPGQVSISSDGIIQTSQMAPIPLNGTRSERYNNFYTVGLSIVKSFAMLTGELEGSYLHLEGLTYSALFMLFVFLVTIVLYNLLNALAVSDTQEIKSDAKLIDLQQRILAMQQTEETVFLKDSYMSNFLKRIISMFPDTFSDGTITLRPNDDKNQFVYVSNKKLILNKWLPKFLGIFKHQLKMNEEIIQDIRALVTKKYEERILNDMRKLKENRYEKMASDIVKLNEMMTTIQDNMISLQSHVFSKQDNVNNL